MVISIRVERRLTAERFVGGAMHMGSWVPGRRRLAGSNVGGAGGIHLSRCLSRTQGNDQSPGPWTLAWPPAMDGPSTARTRSRPRRSRRTKTRAGKKPPESFTHLLTRAPISFRDDMLSLTQSLHTGSDRTPHRESILRRSKRTPNQRALGQPVQSVRNQPTLGFAKRGLAPTARASAFSGVGGGRGWAWVNGLPQPAPPTP
jgi:hypothetical protein